MKKMHLSTFLLIIILTGISLSGNASSPNLVISQIYGGGTSATYKNDYIELFNRGTMPVTITNWSVQYAAATGTVWSVTVIASATIPAGGYFLIKEAANSSGTSDLPTPDVTGTINLGSGAGKVALVNSITALSGSCPLVAEYIDLVGYSSTASCYEGGAPAPTSSATGSLYRKMNGCTDTDVNSADFVLTPFSATEVPRNSFTTLAPCSFGSTNTDYFRTRQNGNWNNVNTWQSSPDNVNWYNATLTPDINANTITISTMNAVIVTQSVIVDQLVLSSGSNSIVNSGVTFIVQ